VASSYRQLHCTPSILILMLSVVPFVLFCTPTAYSFGIRLSDISSARTTQHRKHRPIMVVEVRYHTVVYQTVLARTIQETRFILIAYCYSRLFLVRYPALDTIYCSVLYALLSKGCLPSMCLSGIVFIEPLPSCGSVRHSIIPFIQFSTV
jgi:hypothetical protein